jgi:serine protease Do
MPTLNTDLNFDFGDCTMFETLMTKTRALASVCLVTAAIGLSFMPIDASHAQVKGLPDFTELVEQVGPSVVNIRTLEKVKASSGSNGQNGGSDEEMQELFRRFFGQPMPGNPRQPTPRQNRPQQQEEDQPRGVGSGFILTSDGYVMTNAHVVDGADEMIVTLTDKREFKAKLIGADKRTDVAVVKIEATGLPAVKIGDVARLKVGEWVMAIGSPFGLENSVTAGIVSAKQRDTGEFIQFIQTDVAVNPGNSGGPLINMRGEVVGVNSQILSRTGNFAGVSLSIPIDEAIRVSEQLRASGRVTRGRIGVQIGAVTKDIAESLGLGKAQGALVNGVVAGGPSEKAGIEAGDIITKFDGRVIEKSSDLPRIVGATKPGNKGIVTVYRRGAYKEIAVVVDEFEPEKVVKKVEKEEKSKAVASAQALGLTVSDLTDAQRKEIKIKGGVRVDAAADGAARAGLREGDLILAVGNTEVVNLKEFEAAVAKTDKTKAVNVLFRRGEWAQYALIRPVR